ncbi:F0F1 ATP synthase subunit epsilon [Salinicoccus halitifaciens]|uniref:ATP synthase epsilon chain n=1 Tax=Salinicoccus halitifaciens TaxID=1073415 RepID=A0ABV2E9Y3_9STAP|nr:F0F1 ATP synthase subunit epsilon [Salinicoccus halitifaciens]MCD2138114.1 F0F1 ATP synthase subunit epsilon [Salinicoccus halitifaciens]
MTISLDIVTPNGSVFFEEDCELIVLQSKQGELGIMGGHIPTVAALKIGSLRAKINGQYEYFAVTEGFAEINPSKVTVLVQAGEFAEDIDTERAEAARQRAEELLQRSQDEKVDRYRAELALRRAINRIEVSKHK